MLGKGFKKKLALFVALVIVLSCFSFSVFAGSSAEKADTVYINGNIYMVDSKFSKATALAVKGQYLTYVGDDKGTKSFVGENTKVVDLGGKTVLPGIIEGHMHFPMLGENLIKIDAFWKPKQEILDAVKKEASNLAPGEWIQGFGWNNEVWENKSYPTKEELDAVAPNNPVLLERTDGHMIWVNSKALEIGGITKDSKNPQGGEILRDSQGNPTGCLTDTASDPVRSKVPALSVNRKKEALLRAQDQLFSLGITSSMNAGSPLADIQNMKDLYKEGKLKIRIYSMIGGSWGDKPGANVEAYYKSGPDIGLFDNRFTARCVKLFADGSLGSRSAALLADYNDRPGHKGNLKYTDEEFYQEVKKIREHGFQIATHAIGDAAVNQVLNTYERVLKENPSPDHRYRIEHFQVATLDDIKRIAKLGVIPAMQATHATSDKNMAENRIGPERIKGAYAWRKVIDAGSIIADGSDAPVELANPYHGLYAAVTRMDRDGNPPGGWYAGECMTRVEALKSFTIWAAYAQFEDKIKGSLETGKLADFVVVDRDYMTCPAADIKDINALTTVVGGETVYERPSSKDITVMVKGKTYILKAKPSVEKGRFLVSDPKVLEGMGAGLTYDKNTGMVSIKKDTVTLTFKVGDMKAEKNGTKLSMDVPAKVIDNNLYFPLRFTGEALGFKVMWYSPSQTVSINP